MPLPFTQAHSHVYALKKKEREGAFTNSYKIKTLFPIAERGSFCI